MLKVQNRYVYTIFASWNKHWTSKWCVQSIWLIIVILKDIETFGRNTANLRQLWRLYYPSWSICCEGIYIHIHAHMCTCSLSTSARCAACIAHTAMPTIVLNFREENVYDQKSNHEIHENIIVPWKFATIIRYLL